MDRYPKKVRFILISKRSDSWIDSKKVGFLDRYKKKSQIHG